MVNDRQPPTLPVAQLCIWLAAFCAGLLALMTLATGDSRPQSAVGVYTPDPDYLAKRCSEPRTGFMFADLPACQFAPRTKDVALYSQLFEDRDENDHSSTDENSSHVTGASTSPTMSPTPAPGGPPKQ